MKFKINEVELSFTCTNDLKLYTKCFFDFCTRYKSSDEIKDLVSKISTMLNKAFELQQTETVKEFIHNMTISFTQGENRIYLVRILKMLLE